MENQELMEVMASLVKMEYFSSLKEPIKRVQMEIQVSPDYPVPRENQENREMVVNLVIKVTKDNLDSLELLEIRENLVPREKLVMMERPEKQEIREFPVPPTRENQDKIP